MVGYVERKPPLGWKHSNSIASSLDWNEGWRMYRDSDPLITQYRHRIVVVTRSLLLLFDGVR